MTTQYTEALMEALQELNEEEQFYKAYYLAKQKKSTLSAFLSARDADEICKRGWLVPELLGDSLEDMIAQKERFDTTCAHGVEIQKHPRYMPPYEHSSPVFEILYVLSGRQTCHRGQRRYRHCHADTGQRQHHLRFILPYAPQQQPCLFLLSAQSPHKEPSGAPAVPYRRRRDNAGSDFGNVSGQLHGGSVYKASAE